MRPRLLQTLALALPLALVAPADEGDALTREPIIAGVRVFYGPEAGLERIDVGLLAGARRAIDMAAYVLTNRAVIAALREAAQRGVRVRLYLDPDQRRDRRPDPMSALSLLIAEPNVETRYKAQADEMMHLKAFQVDGRVLRTGSTNFSYAGARRQDNDIVVIESRRAAGDFIAAFEALWSRPDNERTRP